MPRPREFRRMEPDDARLHKQMGRFGALLDPAAQRLGYPNVPGLMMANMTDPNALRAAFLKLNEETRSLYHAKYGEEPPDFSREHALRDLENARSPEARTLGKMFRQILR